jgi:uncharacterized protein HemX
LRFNFVFVCYVGVVIEKPPVPGPSSKKSARLRKIGVIVLVLGIAGAGVIYWQGTRSANLNDDLAMQAFNRAEQRQMGQLYGKSGLLIEQWSDDLKQPGTQAILLAVTSALIAAGCFYFARLLESDSETTGSDDSHHGG